MEGSLLILRPVAASASKDSRGRENALVACHCVKDPDSTSLETREWQHGLYTTTVAERPTNPPIAGENERRQARASLGPLFLSRARVRRSLQVPVTYRVPGTGTGTEQYSTWYSPREAAWWKKNCRNLAYEISRAKRVEYRNVPVRTYRYYPIRDFTVTVESTNGRKNDKTRTTPGIPTWSPTVVLTRPEHA